MLLINDQLSGNHIIQNGQFTFGLKLNAFQVGGLPVALEAAVVFVFLVIIRNLTNLFLSETEPGSTQLENVRKINFPCIHTKNLS